MYYKEKLINGVLMCKRHPDGAWEQVSIELLSKRSVDSMKTIMDQAARINELEDALCTISDAAEKVMDR